MKKLLFVSTTLGNGGAERVMLYLLNHFSQNNSYNISLLLIRNKGNDYLLDLSEKVNVYNLGLDNKRVRSCIFPLLKAITHINPDMCFIGHVELNLLISPFIKWLPKNIKFIARETSILSVRYNKERWKKLLYKLFYRNYKLIIAQSDDMRNDLIRNWFTSPSRCIKINNPIDLEYVKKNAQKPINITFFRKDTFNMVAIGKLAYQKGYDILLTRLSELQDKDFRLIILGKGDLQQELEEKIKAFNLSENVKLEGFNPYSSAYLAQADGLILSSRYEGFPNVLLEANALGKAVFSNNCLGGINEIIIPGINGYIADFSSPANFHETYQLFKSHQFDPKAIIQLTADRYSKVNILPLYEKAFDSLIK